MPYLQNPSKIHNVCMAIVWHLFFLKKSAIKITVNTCVSTDKVR